MSNYYVVLYDGQGNKFGGYNCDDAIHGLRLLPGRGTRDNIFTFVNANCFYWEPDKLPVQQWVIEIA